MRRVSVHAAVYTVAAALALILFRITTSNPVADLEVTPRKAAASNAHIALAAVPGTDTRTLAPHGRSLQFAPLKATATEGARTRATSVVSSTAMGAGRAAADGVGSAAPAPSVAPAVINQFDFRIEPVFRQQLDAALAGSQPARLLFPVAQDRMVDLVITRHDAQNTTRGVVYAHPAEHPEAQAVLAYVDEAVAGTIVTPDAELFVVRYAGNGAHRVLQLDPNQIPPEDELPVAQRPSGAGRANEAALLRPSSSTPVRGPGMPATADDLLVDGVVLADPDAEVVADRPLLAVTPLRDGANTIVDMLIVYTSQSRAGNGGVAGMNALINASVARANLAFANSGAGVLLRVVFTAEVNYASDGLSTTFGALQDKTDGWMDDVHTWRLKYNADIVSLFVPAGSDGRAGLGGGMNPMLPSPSPYDMGFSVVVDIYADGNLTLAHEVGHHFGAGHFDCCGVFQYSGAVRFTVAGQTYRTVMADGAGLRIPYFSNPNLSYLGVPIGGPGNNNRNNTLTILTTKVALATLRYGAADWSVSAEGDLNADGKPDLVWRNVLSGRIIAWLMDGVARTSTPVVLAETNENSRQWVPVARADFNADGKPDLLWRVDNGAVYVWYMDGVTLGTNVLIWPGTNAGDIAWVPMAAGDFNADGKADIVWRSVASGRVVVWFMDGVTQTGTATIWPSTTPGDAAWVPLASGDFNGDSKPDLIWRNSTTGRVIIWYMDGVTRTGTSALWSPTNASEAAWRPMAANDFNADGQTDIVWRNVDTGQVLIWYMNGGAPLSTVGIWG
jgi:hypothetical protein